MTVPSTVQRFCTIIATVFIVNDGIRFAASSKQKLAFNAIRARRQAALTGAAFPANRWDQPIAYFFDDAFPESARSVVRAAIAFWQNRTCANFEENGATGPRVRFYAGEGCFSEIGRDGSAQFQNVSIGAGCAQFAPVAHEIGHTLGLVHTHVRPDRDAFITLHPENVPEGMEQDFAEMSAQNATTLGLDYDYGSVMHYTGYNKEGNVIMEAKQSRYQHTMGNTYGPVFSDLVAVNRYLGCGRICLQVQRICLQVQSTNCQHSGFPNPKNCSECICPNGFGGADCTQRAPGESGAPADCGQTVKATGQWKVLAGGVQADAQGQLRQAGCHYHITAPSNQRIQIRIEKLAGVCSPECVEGGLELKFERMTSAGARMCCQSHAGEMGLITTEAQLAVASVCSQQANHSFVLSYRTVSPDEIVPYSNWTVPPVAPFNETAFFQLPANQSNDAHCFDWSPNCVPFQKACEQTQFRQNMAELCRRTCKLCTAAESGDDIVPGGLQDPTVNNVTLCMDQATNCPGMAYLCAGSGSRTFAAQRLCPKTCGICSDDQYTLDLGDQ